MRNPVSRHDFNRASVHEDKKKATLPDEKEGLDEYYRDGCYVMKSDYSSDDPEPIEPPDEEIISGGLTNLMNSEYRRGLREAGIC